MYKKSRKNAPFPAWVFFSGIMHITQGLSSKATVYTHILDFWTAAPVSLKVDVFGCMARRRQDRRRFMSSEVKILMFFSMNPPELQHPENTV